MGGINQPNAPRFVTIFARYVRAEPLPWEVKSIHPPQVRKSSTTPANRSAARAVEIVGRCFGWKSSGQHYRICLSLALSSPCPRSSGRSLKLIGIYNTICQPSVLRCSSSGRGACIKYACT